MAGPAFVSGFAAMGDAFLRSYQAEGDRLRRRAAEEAESAWQNELRGKKREEWGREDAVRRAYERAMSTPEPSVELTPLAPKAAGGITVADQGRAEANAGTALRGYPGTNSPAPAANSGWHNRMMRVSDAIAHLDPKQAMEIRDSAMRSRSAEIKLNREEQDEVDRNYNNIVMEALYSDPAWQNGAARFAKEVMNVDFVPELSDDGRKVTFYTLDGDGNRKNAGTYGTDEKGMLGFANKVLRVDASVKLAALTKNMEYERARADKAEDREADLAGRERLARTEARLREGAAARASARSQASDAERAAAGVALYQERNPNATPAEIEAVRRGILPAVQNAAKDAPSEVKLATAMVEAGLAPDMRAGLEMAVTKKSQSARETYLNLMKPNSYGRPPKEQDVAPVMEAAYGPDWRAKILAPERGRADAATGRSIARGQVVNGYEFLGGDPKSQKSWRQVSSGRVN